MMHVAPSGAIELYGCDFLLVINCTRGRILHRYRDIAFDRSKIVIKTYLATPLALVLGNFCEYRHT